MNVAYLPVPDTEGVIEESSMNQRLFLSAAVFLATVAFAGAGQADEIQFTLTDCNTSSGCSPQTGNNFGTVSVTDVSTGVVKVDVDLAPSYTWAKTGLEGFVFNLTSGLPTPTLSGVTASNWTPTSGSPQTSFNSDGMGSGQYGLDFTGANNSVSANLDFTLTAVGLSVTSFTTGGTSGDTGKKYYFLADICTKASGNCGDSGGTGLVGAGVGVDLHCGTTCVSSVPVPVVGAGLPGLVVACGGLLALARRRRQKVA
jgi:hypothetical protein